MIRKERPLLVSLCVHAVKNLKFLKMEFRKKCRIFQGEPGVVKQLSLPLRDSILGGCRRNEMSLVFLKLSP